MPLPTRRTALAAFLAAPLARSAPDSTVCGLGIGTYGLQGFALAAALRLIAENGYDCAEITVSKGSTGDPAKLTPELSRSLRALLDGEGLRLSALMADLPLSGDPAAHAAQLDTLRLLLDLARELSPARPPLIQTVLGGKDWVASKDFFRDRLADWLKLAADRKIILAIKPHRGNAMSRPTDAIWLFEQLGSSPWLRMVYDYSHYALRNPALTIAETVAQSLPWTAYVAAKDALERDGKVVFALTGEGGGFDQADIVRAFYAGGYRGDFCCEVSAQIWKGPGYDPVAALKTCHRNLAAAFERAGVARG